MGIDGKKHRETIRAGSRSLWLSSKNCIGTSFLETVPIYNGTVDFRYRKQSDVRRFVSPVDKSKPRIEPDRAETGPATG